MPTIWDFQVKYNSGWETVHSVDENIGPWIWLMFKAKYKKFHVRKVVRKEKK